MPLAASAGAFHLSKPFPPTVLLLLLPPMPLPKVVPLLPLLLAMVGVVAPRVSPAMKFRSLSNGRPCSSNWIKVTLDLSSEPWPKRKVAEADPCLVASIPTAAGVVAAAAAAAAAVAAVAAEMIAGVIDEAASADVPAAAPAPWAPSTEEAAPRTFPIAPAGHGEMPPLLPLLLPLPAGQEGDGEERSALSLPRLGFRWSPSLTRVKLSFAAAVAAAADAAAAAAVEDGATPPR